MAEVRLADLRIGFSYAVEITFPPGFLEPSERCRMKLRRYLDDPAPVDMTDERLGDDILFTLTEAETATMLPGTYIGEAIVYDAVDGAIPEIPLVNNRYILSADFSPSGPPE